MTLLEIIYALKIVENLLKIKNLTFSFFFEKFKVTVTKFCELLRNSAEAYQIPRHGIPYTSLIVKKGTEFHVDRIL
jgi:hypothetical protein